MSLDLDGLLNEGKKIYVKNTSRPMGHIVLTFVTAHGKAVPRNIPRTWIPICLTDTLSPDVIAQSNELRQFLNKGILALVEPEKAAKYIGYRIGWVYETAVAGARVEPCPECSDEEEE